MQTSVNEQLHVFEELESEVRGYIRSFPTMFTKALGSKMWDKEGREYIDFFSGAGALNYGHNHPLLKQKVLEYLQSDSVVLSLDMATPAKEEFLQQLNEVILKPRNLNYKVMFPGPTGTNSVETALKLVRKVTGRQTIISFTNAYHGMTLGSLAVSGNAVSRKGAGVQLNNTIFMPYEGYFGDDVDSITFLEKYLADNSSGVELPAAIILETIQGQAGLKVASPEWIQKVWQICRRYDILLIIDDIQAGCGRAGTFFSFETVGVDPDIVCLSKSLSGYGLPLAITLIKPEYDIWAPAEHTGTFRGTTPAFVTATETFNFWKDPSFEKDIQQKGEKTRRFLNDIVEKYPTLQLEVRGRGLMIGIAGSVSGFGGKVSAKAFQRGLILDKCGPDGEVAKLFPPVNTDEEVLEKGLHLLEESIAACVEE